MKEPKEPKIINLGEERKKRENEDKRTELDTSPDGYLLYPERKTEITVDEALEIADDVIKKYGDPKVLVEDLLNKDLLKRKKHESDLIWPYKDKDYEDLEKQMESSLESHRSQAKLIKTKGLLEILALHKKYPAYFSGTKILADAEELKSRFPLAP
jgi:hypothetical protein